MTPARPKDISGAHAWLLREWSDHFRAALEAMCDGAATVELVEERRPAAGQESFGWRQPFDLAPEAWAIAQADRAVWWAIGERALAAAGISDASAEDIRSTYQEILQQAFSGLASSIRALLGRDVQCPPGQTEDPPSIPVAAARFSIGDQASYELFFAPSDPLLRALLPAPEPEPGLVPTPGEAPQAGEGIPRTIELLYDVELPVSVSFGRAHLQLKEVLKLTTGSIVELNRAVTEPVELIVNNCVIARGEVVVVEGNYGVRIQQILSRKDRLRTLN